MLNTSRGARFGASLLVLLALGCGASEDADHGDPGVDLDQPATGSVQAPIIGGVQASAYREAALVTMYVGGSPRALCSGALIAPRVVLTAGHCVTGYDGWKITLPYAQSQIAFTARASTLYQSTGDTVNRLSNDVGVILLDKPLTLDVYPVLQRSLLANGTQAINVGRIDDGVTSSTDLFYGPAQSLRNGSVIGYPYSYYTPVVIQSGDSGGPVVVAGSNPHIIAAVNSGSGSSYQVLARVDLAIDWLTQQINANGGPGSAACACTTTDRNQQPVTVACGASTCGNDGRVYSCLASQSWSGPGAACGGGSSGGTADTSCVCTTTDRNQQPVTVACGATTCGNDGRVYSCLASQSWSGPGATCGSNSGTGGSNCACTTTDRNQQPVTVACGASTCGNDGRLYGCLDSQAWSAPGAACTDGGGAVDTNCACTTTDRNQQPVTVACGASTCGNDGRLYSCLDRQSWSAPGAACSVTADEELEAAE